MARDSATCAKHAEQVCANGRGVRSRLILSPQLTAILLMDAETSVKILFSVSVLVGTLGLLLNNWAGHVLAYL